MVELFVSTQLARAAISSTTRCMIAIVVVIEEARTVTTLDDYDRVLQRAFDETLAIVRGETAPWSASPVRDRTLATPAAPPSCLHQPVDIRAKQS
jgi:hypothetical protein